MRDKINDDDDDDADNYETLITETQWAKSGHGEINSQSYAGWPDDGARVAIKSVWTEIELRASEVACIFRQLKNSKFWSITVTVAYRYFLVRRFLFHSKICWYCKVLWWQQC